VGHQVQQERLAQKDHRVYLGHKVRLEQQVQDLLDHRVHRVLLDRKALSAQLELQDRKDHRVYKDHKGQKVQLVLLVQ
jgi:hypothetical protein